VSITTKCPRRDAHAGHLHRSLTTGFSRYCPGVKAASEETVTVGKFVLSDDLIGQLREAGIADEDTTRVVIDLRAGELAVVYCERVGTRSLIEVMAAMSRVAVRVHGAHRAPEENTEERTDTP
jgi:hypothetical protein